MYLKKHFIGMNFVVITDVFEDYILKEIHVRTLSKTCASFTDKRPFTNMD